MSKIVRRRKGGIRISKKGKISYSPGGVHIGGKSGGVNLSKRGVSSSVRAPAGSYNTRTGFAVQRPSSSHHPSWLNDHSGYRLCSLDNLTPFDN